MKHSISPYPSEIKVKSNGFVFKSNKLIGEVEKVQNWGNKLLLTLTNNKIII